jgi:hypothetical protein
MVVAPHSSTTPPVHPSQLGVHASRWAVILVRLPANPSRLSEVLPRSEPVRADELPLITRVTRDAAKAQRTAARLRLVGAKVVVIEEPIERGWTAFCLSHPAQLAARNCEICEAAICPGCMVAANGLSLCERCRDDRQNRSRGTRKRQLILALFFTAFIYQVVQYLQDDQAKIAGNGPIRVGIFQFADRSTLHAPIVRTLNAEPVGATNHQSLADLGPWFDSEHKRYTGATSQYMQIEARGPFVIDIAPPPLAKDGDTWFQTMFRAWQYPRYFHDLVSDQGINVDDYGVKVYVIYGNGSRDLASHSRGSKKGRVAVVFVSAEEKNAAYALTTMAHEIGHALGAADAYDPATSLAMHPFGFVEPFRNPLYPQRFSELMAVDLPVAPKLEVEVANLNQVRVGYQTAADMNWIDKEKAHLFFTPPEITPEQRLDPLDDPGEAPK